MDVPSPYFIRPNKPAEDLANPHQVVRPPFEEDEGRIDVFAYLRTLRKHLRLILVMVIAVALVTALHVSMLTPVYTATATVLLKPGIPTVLTGANSPADAQAQYSDYYDNFYATQYEILKSRSLAAEVIKKDGLDRDVIFTGQANKPKQPSLYERWRNSLTGQIRQILPGAPPPKRSAVPARLEPLAPMGVNPGLIDRYLGALQISPVSETSLVRIVFNTSDPQLSANLANAHAHAYIRQGVELHSQANEEAEAFLKQRLVELKESLEKSEVALNDYRRAKGIVPGLISLDGKETVVLDRVSVLSKELTQAQIQKVELEAQVEQLKKNGSGTLAFQQNKAIEGIQSQLSTIDAEYASLSKQFKPEYPPLAQIQAKRAELMNQVNEATRKAVAGVEEDYTAAKAKEKNLQTEMDKVRNDALNLNDASVEYAILQREVDTNRELYNNVLQRMKDVGLAAEAQTSNVMIVDDAEVPGGPSGPHKMQEILRYSLLAFAGGIAIAFLLEYLNNTLKTPEDVERYLRIPNLAMVPSFADSGKLAYGSSRERRGARAHVPKKVAYGRELVSLNGPHSVVGESYRTLRTALMLSRAGSPPKSILFTSATNAEGKTVTASNTAVMFAHSGAKVVLIDADLRRPRCHKVFAVENKLGLTEALTGARELNELMHKTEVENLWLLSSGSFPPNPTELLGSTKMRETLDQLMGGFDMVVIDCPPIMPVSDGLLLSTMVDGVVLVINSNSTAKQQSRAALMRLEFARAKVFGVVLNNVNVRSPDYQMYSSYYYSHYHGYDPETSARDQREGPEDSI
jgi:succinoglycan biosynthesis transport protein ExoP